MKMEEIHVLLFYKFVRMDRLEEFQKKHLRFCNEIGVKGRVLVAEEGINGSVSGTKEQVEKYKEKLTSDKRFSDMRFKEELGLEHPFRRMSVLIRNEIVALKEKVDMNIDTPYITPKELKDLYDKNEDENIIILDTRNDYEYKVGHFKNSIHLNLKTFREFPEKIKELADKKDKKIVTFCTGGIRCEKAARYMKQIGFNDVSQLKDGIISYEQEFPNTYWEGKCFVFDKRLVSDVGKSGNTITKCSTCNADSDLYRNCRNLKCDKLYTQCKSCQEKYSGNCSKECLKEFQKQCLIKSIKNQGRKTKIAQ